MTKSQVAPLTGLTRDQKVEAYIHATLILIDAENSGEEPVDDTAALRMTAEYEEETIRHNEELARHKLRLEEIENKYWDSIMLRAVRILEKRRKISDGQ